MNSLNYTSVVNKLNSIDFEEVVRILDTYDDMYFLCPNDPQKLDENFIYILTLFITGTVIYLYTKAYQTPP